MCNNSISGHGSHGKDLTMMGNNIFQCFILENKYNADAPFAIPPTERFEKLMRCYAHYTPDIIAFQECDEGWHDLLDGADGLDTLGYTAATDGYTNESLRMIRNILYYKKDRLTVEEAGYEMYDGTSHGAIANPWCYSWAIFKDKVTGKRFAATSTHFVWVSIDNWAARDRFAHQLSEFIVRIEKEYGVPSVSMGDYNAHIDEPAYSTMKTNLLSAREVTPYMLNMELKSTNRVGQPPQPDTDGHGIVDHCFISEKGVSPKVYELLIDPMTYAYSDHVPQRLTFEID